MHVRQPPWNFTFSDYIFSKKVVFFVLSVWKNSPHWAITPWNFFWLPLEKSTVAPPGKIFPTSMRKWLLSSGIKQLGKNKQSTFSVCVNLRELVSVGARGGSRGPIDPPETNESYFIYYDFVQFGKQYSRYNSENSIRNKTWLPSITEFTPSKLTAWIRSWLGQERIHRGWLGRSPTQKPAKVTLFTIILCNPENICDISRFCRLRMLKLFPSKCLDFTFTFGCSG